MVAHRLARASAIIRLIVALCLVAVQISPVRADLRSAPAWYDQNAVAVTPDWHYRVPVTVSSGNAVNSTVRVDVDFAALLAQMNVSGTFDANSVRIVRPTGALSTRQEYTDTVYSGATDATGNGRGEVRFLAEDAGPATYYIYFDVTQNGTKAANPQLPINGNFETGSTGLAQPTGWNAPTRATTNYDAQMRPAETVSVTAQPNTVVDGSPTRSTNGNPNTGSFSYLIGWRTSTAALTANVPGVTFTRTITVPASNPGNLTFRWKPQGWDAQNFDYLRVTIVGSTTTEIIGPTANNYTMNPFSPNIGGAAASATSPGYRQYNGFDCDTTGTHRNGMTVACHSEPWFTVNQSLAAFAGQTVTLTFTASQDTADQSWYLLDDIEWSVSTGTLGSPQAFGVNITAPLVGAAFVPGQLVPITATVDAAPAATTTPVTANVYDSTGTLITSGIILYNDGTHGDATAGDAIWTNDGSVPANQALVVPLGATNATGWTLRVFARDATTNSAGGTNGIAHIPGQAAPETQAGFWNIDDSLFDVAGANIVVTKTSSVISDPLNGTTNPKFIPGATVRYCVLITNNGPATATAITATDPLPGTVTFVPGSMRSGTACATAATVEDDNNTGADESDPVGASFSSNTVVGVQATLANAATIALTFDATVQ